MIRFSKCYSISNVAFVSFDVAYYLSLIMLINTVRACFVDFSHVIWPPPLSDHLVLSLSGELTAQSNLVNMGSNFLFLHFGAAQEVMTRENTIRNEEKRSVEWFNLSAILGLSSLTSHTRHQAARSSPRWRRPDLEFLASLDQNFIGLESFLEVEISLSNLPLYNLFVGKKKKKTAILE